MISYNWINKPNNERICSKKKKECISYYRLQLAPNGRFTARPGQTEDARPSQRNGVRTTLNLTCPRVGKKVQTLIPGGFQDNKRIHDATISGDV